MNLDPQCTWYGIRTIYHFGKKKDGKNLFEERVCVFSGKTSDEAFAKAQAEAATYSKHLNESQHLQLEWHPVQESYLLDDFLDEPSPVIVEGYEVWSDVFEFDGDLAAFVQARYERFHYHPDE